MINNIYDFSRMGIDTSIPGFYNDPAFLRMEEKTPSFLNEYNKFVFGKTYTEEYLLYAKKKIDIVSKILFDELSKTKRNGACIDIAQVLMLILEKEGIWSCMFDGSMTIEYHKDLNIENAYYHTVDSGDFSSAHAWIAAPPYKIIDLSIYLQEYESNEKQYIPKYILEENVTKAKIQAIDIISPEAALHFKCSLEDLLDVYFRNNTSILEFIKYFPPVYVQSNKIKIKYIALHGGASDGNLETVKCLNFCGRTPFELYVDKIKPELKNI